MASSKRETKLTDLLDENEWKPIVWNLSFFLEMTPCLYTGVQYEQV